MTKSKESRWVTNAFLSLRREWEGVRRYVANKEHPLPNWHNFPREKFLWSSFKFHKFYCCVVPKGSSPAGAIPVSLPYLEICKYVFSAYQIVIEESFFLIKLIFLFSFVIVAFTNKQIHITPIEQLFVNLLRAGIEPVIRCAAARLGNCSLNINRAAKNTYTPSRIWSQVQIVDPKSV